MLFWQGMTSGLGGALLCCLFAAAAQQLCRVYPHSAAFKSRICASAGCSGRADGVPPLLQAAAQLWETFAQLFAATVWLQTGLFYPSFVVIASGVRVLSCLGSLRVLCTHARICNATSDVVTSLHSVRKT